eukprot:SAG31_NODE_16870_length_692_cov_1.150084_1_plen_150_part_10
MYDDEGVVTELVKEPDGEPGPAEQAGIRVQQKIMAVNDCDVEGKAAIDAILMPANVVGGIDSAKFVMEGVGQELISEDDLLDGETEEEFLARQAAEDEAALAKEMEDEEAMAARAEEELAARIAAEAEAEKQRLATEEERKKQELAEFQE